MPHDMRLHQQRKQGNINCNNCIKSNSGVQDHCCNSVIQGHCFNNVVLGKCKNVLKDTTDRQAWVAP
jgi:hypothetical protein